LRMTFLFGFCCCIDFNKRAIWRTGVILRSMHSRCYYWCWDYFLNNLVNMEISVLRWLPSFTGSPLESFNTLFSNSICGCVSQYRTDVGWLCTDAERRTYWRRLAKSSEVCMRGRRTS
jgi:hypothetical protein